MKDLSMQIFNVRSAGIDVGSRFHVVAVDQRSENVRQFGVYSEDHQAMIEWLRLHQIQSIAMESTGNYWQTLFDALQRAGFEVQLVNGNQIKNVKGKKDRCTGLFVDPEVAFFGSLKWQLSTCR
jgi:transposase